MRAFIIGMILAKTLSILTLKTALRRCGVYVTDIRWDLKHKINHDSPWFWLQDLWSRLVNWCAGGTALAKRLFDN
ncbi:MAG: hypothetical protein Q8O74_02305 [bacterium]|nr:hypothetical protein [bacterium]